MEGHVLKGHSVSCREVSGVCDDPRRNAATKYHQERQRGARVWVPGILNGWRKIFLSSKRWCIPFDHVNQDGRENEELQFAG